MMTGTRSTAGTARWRLLGIAAAGLCLGAAPDSGQITDEDGSTIAFGGSHGSITARDSAELGGLLMDNGCIGDGSGWSVSGTNGPFGGFTQFQRFTVPPPGWNINAIGVEGHVTFNPNGTGLLGRVWPDDGTGMHPDETGTPLTTTLHFLASDPFSCNNWQDDPTAICLPPGDYWFQYDDDDDPDYEASAKNGTSGGPAFSRRNNDKMEFPHGPLALRIFGGEQACVECPGEGDCCQANGTPGCDEEDCCSEVCEVDPFCCEVEWDQTCADEAAEICFPLCGGGASLDIKPGSCPNPFNRNSNGVLPVALVGTDGFDVTTVDLATVVLSRADGVGGAVPPHEGPPGPHSTYEDVATPVDGDGEPCDCHELEGDGIMDLSLKFKTQDVVSALELGGLSPGDVVELCVSGSTLDGDPFEACDCIVLVPPGSSPGAVAVGSTLPGLWISVTPLDEQLDGGGFTPFSRTYPDQTLVRFEAPPMLNEHAFVGWYLNGQLVEGAGTSIELPIVPELQSLSAIYSNNQFVAPGP